ncbi:glycosyltransferase [Bizionia saleffrena]|uniref:Glycosyltransferase n=1 Tax=Bizionia saleffrena TaxID=291189 RepID=A0A8H2QG16_9FLAO|nr:glycosyltransferase [Bizionia saleffrena]TYB77367.1 glycosyltransferase [Bizionia saleffrena]
MQLMYSFIIPVFNRPNEIQELLDSFLELKTACTFEIIIVEDGSTKSSKQVVDSYTSKLDISYFFKENSGPGASRNYGMERANGHYFIILDSDCILPSQYLNAVNNSLQHNYVDCFGGPDAAHASFSNLQKAINFSMTSFLTTGGIRGHKKSVDTFQPRSFNMGLSKKAFHETQGFGRIHPGEDPDLTIRLWTKGFKTNLIPEAYVFHKRRISWSKFYTQVNKFGMVRPILNYWHPETKKITYWFPFLFSFSCILSLLLTVFGILWPLYCVFLYYILVLVSATIQNKSIIIGFQSLIATTIQFFGYGYGFIKSTLTLTLFNKKPEEAFPKLFFKIK